MVCARQWKDGTQSVWRGEVNRIIKPWIGAHSTLEPTKAINFPKKLNLQPSVTYLHGSAGLQDPRQLGNPNQRYRGQ
jgi:hypothetical protein